MDSLKQERLEKLVSDLGWRTEFGPLLFSSEKYLPSVARPEKQFTESGYERFENAIYEVLGYYENNSLAFTFNSFREKNAYSKGVTYFKRYYGLGGLEQIKNKAEIARQARCSPENVRQRVNRILRLLKTNKRTIWDRTL